MPKRAPQHRPPWAKSREQAERDRKAFFDKRRPSAAKRGYDAAWRKLRAEVIADNPICQWPGCSAPSIDADHIQSVRDRPDLRLNRANLRALCRSHHSGRTAREQGFARGRRRGE